jgi:hypothetical protein
LTDAPREAAAEPGGGGNVNEHYYFTAGLYRKPLALDARARSCDTIKTIYDDRRVIQ